ncbi:MAG: hypothetical protein ACERKD_09465 [Prolixibacteraceae bacterium]
MKTLYLLIVTLFITTNVSAQMYEKSVGVRLGYSTGIFFEKQNSDLTSYRFMMSVREGGRHFTAMKCYRKYKMENLPNYLSLYYGYGAHLGYIKWYQQGNEDDYGYFLDTKSAPVIGIDALIGISYDFEKLPISFTCDVKPFIDLWGRHTFSSTPLDFSIGATYSF